MTPLNQVLPIAAVAASPAPVGGVPETVLSVIAEVTRYPRDILLPEADLEEELGIDSVKRAEIFAVLSSRLHLPQTNDAPPMELRTVGNVIAAVEHYLGTSQPRQEPAAASQPVPGPATLRQRVLDVVADTTRYPPELLVADASLEDDLGFDGVQRAGILSAIRRQLGVSIPESAESGIRTIEDILLLAAAAAAPTTASAASATASSASTAIGTARPQIHAAPAPAAKPLAGRVALITGSGRGLGKTIARHLAGLGATVVVNSFHARQKGEECAQEIIAEGGRAVHLWGSVANASHLSAIFGEIGNQFGGLDFFISNASNGVFAPLADVRPDDWDKAFRTNVVALHQGALLAADLMRRHGGGKIVALSANASQRYVDYFGCMGPVKAAVECLVRYLAIELGGDNIQVNAVAAGPVLGDLLDKYPDFERLRPLWEGTVPRRRLNDESEIAEAVTFLLTASGMNGSVLLVDAGGSQRITAGPR